MIRIEIDGKSAKQYNEHNFSIIVSEITQPYIFSNTFYKKNGDIEILVNNSATLFKKLRLKQMKKRAEKCGLVVKYIDYEYDTNN